MLLILIPVGLYSIFIFFILRGISKLSGKKFVSLCDKPDVSVIVPYRNEKHRVNVLLESLKKLEYPLSKLQFIFVDDHSEDGTDADFDSFAKTTRFKTLLLHLPDGLKGKKAAMELGLMHARAKFVLFTDADCNPNPKWITEMACFAENSNADMVLGPVSMHGKNLVGKFQEAEFLSLQAITMGTAGFGKAVLSNAANMLIRNDCIQALDDPFKRDLSSGDDVFLLDNLQNQGKNIRFNFHSSALVITPASESLSQLLNQRARWLSKTKKYRLNFSMFIAGVFGLLQFMASAVILFLLITGQWTVLALFVFHKIVFDHLVFLRVSLQMRIKTPIFYTGLLSIMYPLWTIMSSLAAFFIKPKWKGRLVKV
ncbi:MAG: glycosyltransferase [Bacteroidales bacterium]|jgi:biofilm PGA synthesis N-glycosyltransferase PgaC|nr:glycosyltransferase [Bacteroidales bacterium]